MLFDRSLPPYPVLRRGDGVSLRGVEVRSWPCSGFYLGMRGTLIGVAIFGGATSAVWLLVIAGDRRRLSQRGWLWIDLCRSESTVSGLPLLLWSVSLSEWTPSIQLPGPWGLLESPSHSYRRRIRPSPCLGPDSCSCTQGNLRGRWSVLSFHQGPPCLRMRNSREPRAWDFQNSTSIYIFLIIV